MRLGLAKLDEGISRLIGKGVAASTRRVYSSGHKRYISFCEAGGGGGGGQGGPHL